MVEAAGRVSGWPTTRPCDRRGCPAREPASSTPSTSHPRPGRRGLGSALLFAAAVDDLRGRGFAPLVLWVIEANARGRRFYERAGWRPDGARQPIDFDGVPVDEIRYRLD